MSHSKNNHKLPDRVRIDTPATEKNEDEGIKMTMLVDSTCRIECEVMTVCFVSRGSNYL